MPVSTGMTNFERGSKYLMGILSGYILNPEDIFLKRRVLKGIVKLLIRSDHAGGSL